MINSIINDISSEINKWCTSLEKVDISPTKIGKIFNDFLSLIFAKQAEPKKQTLEEVLAQLEQKDNAETERMNQMFTTADKAINVFYPSTE